MLKNNRWSTFGAGVAISYKFLIVDRLTIEPLIDLRVVSPPTYNFNDESMEASALGIGEGIGWYLTTGLPLDFQLKFGWQF